MSFLTKTLSSFVAILFCSVAFNAYADGSQTTLINLNPDPNGRPWIAGGLPPLTPEDEARLLELPKMGGGIRALNQLPSLRVAVDNSRNSFFPPVIYQNGGSCSQASGIGYTFTYEMALARQVDPRLNEHRYPEHFTWNFLNNGDGSGSWQMDGWDIARQNGIPNVSTYGGMSTPEPYVKWMSGYDKYYQGMLNRVQSYRRMDHFSAADIDAIKAWLDHRGVGAPVGGILNFSTNINGHVARPSPSGQSVITRFGDSGGHTMAIVGYDDTIQVDANKDGQITTHLDINQDGVVDIRDSEVGAFRIANTWGTGWGDNGFIWVLYSTFALENGQGGIWKNTVHVVDVRQTYEPRYTIKTTLTHPKRGDMRITVGVATSTAASKPDLTKYFTAFNFRGGDYPLRGDVSDPIEIGLDVTDLFEALGASQVARVFLVIDDQSSLTSSTAMVHSVSLMDYSGGTPIEKRGEINVPIRHGKAGEVATTYAAVNLKAVCEQFAATLSQHEAAGRAYTKSSVSWWVTSKSWYAVGSDELLGTSATTQVTLHQASAGVFRKGSCPVPDTTPPVVTLIGDSLIQITQGSTFVDPGVKAIDDRDGDISARVLVTGEVNSQRLGLYSLSYDVSDLAGNMAQTVVRSVNVVSAPACQEFTATVSAHESAGRAYSKSTTSWWTTTKTWYARGSDENLGTSGTATKMLREQPGGSGQFQQGSCPADPLPPGPPKITAVNTVVNGRTVKISGSAVDADNDLHTITLYFAGGGLECSVDAPVGTAGDIAYNCSDMSNWSFVITNTPVGTYDCQGSNGCLAVRATDAQMQGSEIKMLSFIVTDTVVAPCVTAVNTAHAQAGRAELKYNVLYYSVGGNDYLGMGTATTSLSQNSPGVWKKVNSCP